MKFIFVSIFFLSSLFALSQSGVKENCCTQYDGYEDSTQLVLNDNSYSVAQRLSMTPSEASEISGKCDSETKTISSWEGGTQVAETNIYFYTKHVYGYTCKNCDKSSSDFPAEKDGFKKQAITSTAQECLNLINSKSDSSNGSIFQIDSENCPYLFGCYYNIPATETETDTDENNNDENTSSGQDGNTSSNNQNQDLKTRAILTELSAIKTNTATTYEYLELINDNLNGESGVSFTGPLDENRNLFQNGLRTIKTNFESMISIFEGLDTFVNDNPFVYGGISSSSDCNYTFNVYSRDINVNPCLYTPIIAPFVTLGLSIIFIFGLIRLNIYLYMKAFVEGKTE